MGAGRWCSRATRIPATGILKGFTFCNEIFDFDPAGAGGIAQCTAAGDDAAAVALERLAPAHRFPGAVVSG
ncbi:hypothetical protein SDC9_177446 [bioreactor metagenome]|uniref:Uncharacterized protein n=1 Tax=bioreactor metagenome TaxID=1076179 RepID=A0A645GW58_9ZZZZ